MAKTLFVTCKEYSTVYDPERVAYRVDSRFQSLETGTRVTLKVRRPTGKRYKLVQGVVMSSIDDCLCGVCEFVEIQVVVPKAMVEAHLAEESTKHSFDQWWAARRFC